jgi:2-polyprenyl-3-methyl-5-hydroxy-6-metoxy-1,4-benzoquinol methylase
VSISRRTECALFESRVPALFTAADRVLEIGAGTGIFTLTIARHCREVVAVDISGNMLEILERKAAVERLSNIRTVRGNAETIDPGGTFSVACAFSSLEYLSDLPSFFRRLARHIEPGGALYFITARRSLFRFFTQIGNAMRQGLWLKASSRKEVEAMLSASGFDEIRVSSHLLKSWISGGMLLEVEARRRRAEAGP